MISLINLGIGNEFECIFYIVKQKFCKDANKTLDSSSILVAKTYIERIVSYKNIIFYEKHSQLTKNKTFNNGFVIEFCITIVSYHFLKCPHSKKIVKIRAFFVFFFIKTIWRNKNLQ